MCESIHLNTGSTTAHLTAAGLLGNAIVNVTTSNSTPSTSSLSSQPCCSSTPTPIPIPTPTPSSSLSTSTTLLLTPAGCVGSSCASTSCSRRNSSSSSSSSSSCTSSASSVSSNLSSSTVTTTSSTSTMGTSSSSALDFDIDIESAALPIVNNNLSCSTMEKAGCVPVRRRRVRNNHNNNNNNNNNNNRNKNNRHNVGGGHGYVWEVMLVQSLGTPCRWAFPKGSVEPGETPAAAAVRETAEEGGVFGQLGSNLGLWALKRKRLKFQSMWLLLVHTEYAPDSLLWKEGARRSRVWLSFDAARALLSHTPPHARRPELLEMLDSAKAALNLSASTYPSRSLLTIPPDDDT